MTRFLTVFSILITIPYFLGMHFVPPLAAQNVSDELIGAAEMGDINEVRSLLKQGLPVDVTNEDGWTALMKAAYEGYEDLVQP